MMDNWKSPIDLTMLTEEFATKIHDDQTECIIEACMKMGINIDKEELLRALQYDRGQYEKGFADGIKARDEEIVRCKGCKYRDDDDFCTGRGYPNALVPDDGFCDKGERRDNGTDDS